MTCLEPWLHRDVRDQLDLGHSWLEAKNKAKAASSRPSLDTERKWAGLYHDNGSCIDIIVPFVSSGHARVLVLKVSVCCCVLAPL